MQITFTREGFRPSFMEVSRAQGYVSRGVFRYDPQLDRWYERVSDNAGFKQYVVETGALAGGVSFYGSSVKDTRTIPGRELIYPGGNNEFSTVNQIGRSGSWNTEDSTLCRRAK
jgi:hypothetical protein